MRDMRGKVAVVTGAAAGIGRETALALAGQGAKLIVCDRDMDTLTAVRHEIAARSECLLAERVDVARFEEMRAFADKVHAVVPAVDILVNNAGVGMMGSFLSTTLDDWKWIISINLWGVIHGCHVFVPKMAERKAGGHVVNVSSMLGFSIAPDIAGYATTKFGVFGLSLCMRQDLRPHGIGVSVICPGIINTGIVRTSRYRGVADADRTRDHVVRAYQKRNYGPERVARAIVRAIKRNKATVPVSPEAVLTYYVHRVWPAAGHALMRWMARTIEG